MLAWMAAAFAAPISVVAVGDGLNPPAVPAPTADKPDKETGGWVAVVADCLEERAAGKFRVVDRVESGATAAIATEKSRSLADLKPSVVIIGLNAPPTSTPDEFKRDVTALADWWVAQKAEVYLVGVVDPRAGAAAPTAYDGVLKDLAQKPGVVHVPLDWPSLPELRGPLVTPSGHLTEQGHARVGAAACDAVLSHVK